MKRMILSALVLNAALLGIIAYEFAARPTSCSGCRYFHCISILDVIIIRNFINGFLCSNFLL